MSYSDYPPPLPPALPLPTHNRTLSNLSSSTTSSNPNTFSPTRPKVKLNEYGMNNDYSGSAGGSGSNQSTSASPSRPHSPEMINGHRSSSPTSYRTRQPNQISLLNDPMYSSPSRPYGSPSQIIKSLPFPSTHSRFNSVSSAGSSSRQQQQQNQAFGGIIGDLGTLETSPFRRDMTQLPSPSNNLDGMSMNKSMNNGLRSSKGDDNSREMDGSTEVPIPWTPTRKRTFPLPPDDGILDSTLSSSQNRPNPSVLLDYGTGPTISPNRSNSICTSPSSQTTLHHRRSSSNLRKAKLPTLDLSGSLFNASTSSSGSGPLSTALPSSTTSNTSSAATSPGDQSLASENEYRSLRLSHSFGSATTAREGDDSFEGEEGEARRIRRAKRNAGVKEKNQKILDSINLPRQQQQPHSSLSNQSPSSHKSHQSDSQDLNANNDLTSTTLRNYLSSNDHTPTKSPLSSSYPLPNEQGSRNGRKSPGGLNRVPSPGLNLSTGSRTSNSAQIPLINTNDSSDSASRNTIRPRSSMGDMNRYDDSRRNNPPSTAGLDRERDRDRERERRVRTLGVSDGAGRSGSGNGRDSPSNTIPDLGEEGRWSSRNGSIVGGSGGSGFGRRDIVDRERSATSMSTTSRKSDWLDREYERTRGTPIRDNVGTVREETYSARRARAGSDASSYPNSSIDDSARRRRGERSSSPSFSINEDRIRNLPALSRQRPSLPLELISTTTSSSTPSIRRDKDRTLSPRLQPSSLSPRIINSALSSSISSRTTPTTSANSTRGGATPDSGSRRYPSQSEVDDPTSSSSSSANRPLPATSSLGIPGRFEGDSQEGVDPRTLSRARSSARLRSQMNEAQSSAESIRIEKEDVFRNGLRYLDEKERNNSIDERFKVGGHARRGSRTKESEIGSDNWLQDFHDSRQRNTMSRASGITEDSTNSRANHLPSILPQAIQDRDGTIRAINAVLAAQGLVVAHAPSTATKSTPSRTQESENIRRRAMSSDSILDSPASSAGAAFVRPISRAESVRSNRTGTGPMAEHHRLLIQALDHLDSHFTPTLEGDSLLPESLDLVKRITGLVNSTTKLNSGLRALSIAATGAQIDAALDEGRSSSISELVQFEKSVNSLVRASDDQVRSLTEGLIVFTKVDREKDRVRIEGGGGESLRPGSRANGVRGNFSPKRPLSIYDGGATVSNSASRSLATASSRQSLRNPLTPLDEPRVRRSTTLSISSQSPRSPFTGSDSPTPSHHRRQLDSTASPLSVHQEREFTPTRATTTSGGLSAPTSSARRTKSSATLNASHIRSSTPTSAAATSHQPICLPRSIHGTAPILDATNASTGQSPTKGSTSRFEPLEPISKYRTYSEADRATYEALGIDTQGNERRDERDWNYHAGNSSSAIEDESGNSSPEVDRVIGGSRRQRLSTGSVGLGAGVGAVFKNGLTTMGLTRELTVSPEARRQDRRREASDIGPRRTLANK